MLSKFEVDVNNSIKTSDYWTNIEQLKSKYYGSEDEHFAKNYPNNNNKQVDFRETIVIEASGTVRANGMPHYNFPPLPSNKFVYKNLRIKWDHMDNIEYCELECGGPRIDKIYGRVFKSLRYIYDINDEELVPFYFCKDSEYLPNSNNTRINFRFGDKDCEYNLSVSVDVYEINDPEFNHDIFVHNDVIQQCQFTGVEAMPAQFGKFKLDYNHVVNYILVSIPNSNILDLNLRLDDNNICIPIDNMLCYDGHYVIPLTTSLDKNNINKYGINLSRVDRPYLNVKLETFGDIDTRVYIYAINNGAIGIRKNMVGLLYSK